MAVVLARQLAPSLPLAATLCIGPGGDGAGVRPGECAVRAARAGADIVGVGST